MLRFDATLQPDDVLALYGAVGWGAYTSDPERLMAALAGSDWVATAWEDGRLVGLCRAISDGQVIAYLQDVLVHPQHQRRGLGRRLVTACLEHYAGLRQVVLLTDDRPEQLAFYRSLGLTDTRDAALHAFVRLS